MPDKDIDKITITVEVPKADVWVRNDYRDIVQRLGEVHMIRACEYQFDDDWIPLYSIDVIAALQVEIELLRADKRTLTAQLRHIRTHLYAATVQRSPADGRIIADHIEQAYLRANEVIAEMERTDD